MTNRVRILPSGREFVSRGNSTLLEAGLGAGLSLGYGCSNGNCGECLARVVSGKVKQTRHHDYVTNKETGNNQILMCCNKAVSDVVLEATAAQSGSEIPLQQIKARVKHIKFVGNDVALVHLKTPRSQRLRFLAGQHVQLGFNGLSVSTHSVASCPCDDMNLHFSIPLSPGDPFSNHVFETMKRGDTVEIEGPSGDFVLDECSTRPLVFIAWRTGFGPVRSLVEHAMALDVPQDIHLAWIAENKDDRYLDNLCRSWADALDDFHYIAIDAAPDGPMLDVQDMLFNQLNLEPGELTNRDFYIAGNEWLLDSCRAFMLDNGVPVEQVLMDKIIHP